jgi:long-subunit acyl-CoA synthetase (AMP-forming)
MLYCVTGVPANSSCLFSDSKKTKRVDTESCSKFGLINFFEKYEDEKMVIMKENWTIANNMITPSLKVKRNEIEKIHLPKYREWYDKPGTVVWE